MGGREPMNNHALNSDSSGSQTPQSSDASPSSPDRKHEARGFTPTSSDLESPGGEPTVAEHGVPSPGPGRPRTVGKYLILDEVQSGGMGVVYRARDTDLNRIVALKKIKAGQLASSEEIVRFHREAEAAAQLEHPNIVPVYDIGQHEGCLYFTMAFAAGGSLAQHAGRFVADPRPAVALLEKVARAVHFAHQANILHRDLKPANILLDEHGTPWVADFGLAKFVDTSLELTHTGQLLGTPAYMAPEQASGATEQVGPRTDVWALGVILYELLTGQRPFTGKTREERLRQVLAADPPPPRAGGRPLDRGLEAVILKCLEKEPARRYASAAALADDLGRWLRGEPVRTRPLAWPARAWRTARRWRSLALRVGGAAALIALLVLVWKGPSLSGPREEPEDPRQREALQRLLDKLHQGKSVNPFGPSGAPVWSHWQPRQADARAAVNGDQVFQVSAGKQVALLELLPTAPERYRFRARVQHLESRNGGQVGIFFARGRTPAKGGAVQAFFRLTFNDRLPDSGHLLNHCLPGQNPVDLTLPLFRETPAAFDSRGVYLPAIEGGFFPAGKVEPVPWRQLAVEVTPERIRAFWGGMELGACDPAVALDRASRTLANTVVEPEGRPAEWVETEARVALGDGLGLYVDKGTAAFRSLEIEPLPPK